MTNLEIPKAEKIKSFTDLEAWRKGHGLVLEIYKVTKNFPREERYGLVDQLRRAAVSITSNIAEGFTRISYREKVQFYTHSIGSLAEVQNQLIIAKDVGYLENSIFENLAVKSTEIFKIMNGLIKHSKSKILDSKY